jgi:hypothetical protein
VARTPAKRSYTAVPMLVDCCASVVKIEMLALYVFPAVLGGLTRHLRNDANLARAVWLDTQFVFGLRSKVINGTDYDAISS